MMTQGVILCVSTHWAATTTPLFETVAVKDVLTEDGEESSGFIHALEADGASGEFDKGGCRGRKWFGCEGGRLNWRRDGA